MSNTVRGVFCWYELMTRDTRAAEAFYRNVIGWKTKDSGQGDPPYMILSAGSSDIGGMMALSKEMCDAGARPGWGGYIAVDDVDAFTKRVVAKGGKVHRPPAEIPGLLRFAVVADPWGAVFTLFKGLSKEGPLPAAPGTPGTIGWHELYAGDGTAAFEFYSDLFGWTKDEATDMGPMGVYQHFSTGSGPVGGMMTKLPQIPAPFWLYYFNVPAVDEAVARATEGGAKILMGPAEVPGGMWIAQLTDPEGVFFAVVAPKR
jgi:predicted enzyme related to lactoylglutathione lyase